MMGAGSGRHDHCYTEVHIPPTPHMGVGSLTTSHHGHVIQNQDEDNRKFTITLKPGQYRVNVQWKSKTQPFRITLTPRHKSSIPEGPPPLEQQPLFYSTQAPAPPQSLSSSSAAHHTATAPSNISSLPRRLVHRFLYKPSTPSQQCLHPSHNHLHSTQSQVIQSPHPRSPVQEDHNAFSTDGTGQPKELPGVPPHSPSCCNRKGQKRGWDGGPKHRNRKSRYRWGSLSCVHMSSLDESLGEASGCDSFGGYEGVEHLKRHSLSRRHSLNQQALARARQAQAALSDKSFIHRCSKSILWNRFKHSQVPNKNNNIKINNNTKCSIPAVSKSPGCSHGSRTGLTSGGGGCNTSGDGRIRNISGCSAKGAGANCSDRQSPKGGSSVHNKYSEADKGSSSKESHSVPDSPTSGEGTDSSCFIFIGKNELKPQSLSCSALSHGVSDSVINKEYSSKLCKDLPSIPERKTWHEDEAFVKQVVDEYFKDPLPLSDYENDDTLEDEEQADEFLPENSKRLPDLIDNLKLNGVGHCSNSVDGTSSKITIPSHDKLPSGILNLPSDDNINNRVILSSESSSSESSTLSSACSNNVSHDYVPRNLLSPLTEATACVSIDDTFCDSEDSTSLYTDDSLGYEADEEPSDRETYGLLFWRQWRSAPDVSLKQRRQYVNKLEESVSKNSKKEVSRFLSPPKITHNQKDVKTPYATRKSCSVGDHTKLSRIKIGLQKIKTHKLQQFCEETLFGFSKNKKGKNKSLKKDKANKNKVAIIKHYDYTDENSDNDLNNESSNDKEEFEFVNGKYRPGLEKSWCPQLIKDFIASVAKYSETGSHDDSTAEKTANVLSHGLVVTHSGFTPSTAHLMHTIPAKNSPDNSECIDSSSGQSYGQADFLSRSPTPVLKHCSYQYNNSRLATHSNTNCLSQNHVFYNSKLSNHSQDGNSDQDFSVPSSSYLANDNIPIDSNDVDWSYVHSGPGIKNKRCHTKNYKEHNRNLPDGYHNYTITNSNYAEKELNNKFNIFNEDSDDTIKRQSTSQMSPSTHSTSAFKRTTVNSSQQHAPSIYRYITKSSTPSDDHLLSSESPSRYDNTPPHTHSPLPRSSEDSACPKSPYSTEVNRFDQSPEYYRNVLSKQLKRPQSPPTNSGHPYSCKVNSPRVCPTEDKRAPTGLSVCQDEASARSTRVCGGTIRDICVKNECDTAIVNSSPDKDMAKVNITINLSPSVNKTSDKVDLQIPSTYDIPVDNIESGDSNYGYKTYENIPPTWSAKLHRTCYSMCSVPTGEVCFAHRSSSSDQGIGDGTPSSGLGNEFVQSHDDSSSSGKHRRYHHLSPSKNDQQRISPDNHTKQPRSTGVRNSGGTSGIARSYTSSSSSDNSDSSSVKSNDNSDDNNNNGYSVHRIQVGTGGQKKYVQSTQKSVLEVPVTSPVYPALPHRSNKNVVKSELVVNPPGGTKIKQSYSSLSKSIIPPREKCVSEYKIGDTQIYDNPQKNLLASEFRQSYHKCSELENSNKAFSNNNNNNNNRKTNKSSSKTKHKSKPRKYFSGILDALSGRASTPESKNPENLKRMPRRSENKYCSSSKNQLGNATGEKTGTDDISTPFHLSHYLVGSGTSPASYANHNNEYVNKSVLSEQSASRYTQRKEHVNEVNAGVSHPHFHVTRPNNSSASPVEATTPTSTKDDTPPPSTTSRTNVTSSIYNNTGKDNNDNSYSLPVCSSSEVIEATYNIPLNSLSRNKRTSYTVYTSNDSSDNSSCGIYENMVFHRSHSFVKQPPETVSYTINLSSTNCSSSGSSGSSSVVSGARVNSTSGSSSNASGCGSSTSSNSSTTSSKDVNIGEGLRPPSTFSSINSSSPGYLDSSPSLQEPSPIAFNSPSSLIDSSPFVQESPSYASTNSSSNSSSSSNDGTKSNSLIIVGSSCTSSSSSDTQFIYTNTEPSEHESPPVCINSTTTINNNVFVDDGEDDDDEDDDDSDFSSERLSCCHSASSASLASNASSFYYTAGASTVYDAIKSVSEYLSVTDDIPDPPKESVVVEKSQQNNNSSLENRKEKHRSDPIQSRKSDIECLNKDVTLGRSDTVTSITDSNQYVNANISVVNDKIVVTVNPEKNQQSRATADDKDDDFIKAAKQYSSNKISSNESTNKLRENVDNSDIKEGNTHKSDPKIEERLPPIGVGRKKDRYSPFRESRQESPILSRKIDIDMPPLVTMRHKITPTIDHPESTTPLVKMRHKLAPTNDQCDRINPEKFKDEGKPPVGDRRGRFYGRRRSTESAGARLSGLVHAIPCMVVTDSDNRSSVASSSDFAYLPPKPPQSPHTVDSRLSGVVHATPYWATTDSDKSSTTTHDYYNLPATDKSKYHTEHIYENTSRNYGIRRTRSEEKFRDRNSFGLYRDADLSDDDLDDKRGSGLWTTVGDGDIESLSEDNEGVTDGLSQEFHRAQKGNNADWDSNTSLNSQTSSTKAFDDDADFYSQEQDMRNTHEAWQQQTNPWNHQSSIWDQQQDSMHHLQMPHQDHLTSEIIDPLGNPWGYPRGYGTTELQSPSEEWTCLGGSSPYHQHSPSPDHFTCSGPEQSPTRGKPPRSPSHRGRDTTSVPRDGGGRPSPRPRSASRRRSRSASSAAKYRVELEVPVRPRPRPASLASLAINLPHSHAQASQESLYDTRPAPLRLSPVNDVAPDPSWLAERRKNEGNEYYKRKDYREALKLYAKAIEICPDCAAYYSNRSACYMMLGKYSDALADARQAVRLDNTFVKGYIRVGKCNVALGDATAALSVLKHASELEPSNQGVRDEVNNAQNLLRHQEDIGRSVTKDDYRTAIFHLDRALELAVGCKSLKTTKAEYLVFLSRYQEAQEIVNEILQFESGNADAIYVRGMCLYYQDNQDSAFNHFQHVLRLAPDHQRAKEIYKKAKALRMKKDEGNQAFNRGQLSEAYVLYTEALTIDPNNKSTNSKLYFNRATVGFKLNKLEDAVNDCTAAINLDETYVKAFLRRAKCYQSLDQHEEAVRDYEKVFKLDRNQENKRLLQDAKMQLKKSKRKDYYKILGVVKTAGEDEIKKSYRKMALVHHPDRHANSSEKDKREHEIKFKEIGEAYAVLTDNKKRAMYDRGQDVNDPEGGFGHEDQIFQAFFGENQFGGFPHGGSPAGGFTGGFPGGGYSGGSFPGGFHFQFS